MGEYGSQEYLLRRTIEATSIALKRKKAKVEQLCREIPEDEKIIELYKKELKERFGRDYP